MTEKPEAPSSGGSTDGGGKTDGGGTDGGGKTDGGGTDGGGKTDGGGTDGGGKTDGGGMDGGGDGGDGGASEPHPQLPWEDAQRQMLKGMSGPEKVDYFQSDPAAQDAKVQEWHQENFGLPTSNPMPRF